MKKALICGVSGQDGAYLAQLLLSKGYQVWGSSRDAQMANFSNLVRLGIKDHVRLESVSLIDFRSVLQALIKIQPDEVYNLAGQSSVGMSFQQPIETLESIAVGTLNLLEAIRFTNRPIKFYNAASGECFGDTGSTPAKENSPFQPSSPYAVAKATAFWGTVNYRDAYRLFACSGILFNHESPLRPMRFVTRKIVAAACRIAQGKAEILRLGNLSVVRDWGWAPEYVEAMWLIMQQETARDYIVATGESHSLQLFVETAFAYFDLHWRDYVEVDTEMLRPIDILVGKADPSKAERELGWKAKYRMKDVVKMMVQAELAEDYGVK
ncbi:MAG: GDP-mannose 4,6-dehydratase [Acidobacteriota bacterium]|nr:GDP-mannose 4,6-dehydratase [Acidobacteriota bacterium]